MDVIPTAKFYPWKIVIYNELVNYIRKDCVAGDLQQRMYTGLITKSSASKIRNSIMLLNHITPHRYIYNPVLCKKVRFKLSFITLTLSALQEASDGYITRNMLRPFLRHFQASGNMVNYVWKAERQQNDNIHYHIVTDMFMRYNHVLDYWNKLQMKTDMVDRFQAKYGHRSPNSIDIRQCHSDKELDKYLSKYVAKSGKKINGKVWDCSANLHNYDFPTFHIDSYVYNKITYLLSKFNHERVKYDHCTVIYIDKSYYSEIPR